MIARARAARRKRSSPGWHEAFLAMMPRIATHAKIAFRHLAAEARDEAIQEVLCNACRAFARLVELGKQNLAYPSALAHYGVVQAKAGRRVGCRLNVNDVTSEYCQRRKNVTVERLDLYDADEDAWQEVVVEDKRAGPAETAAARIDIDQWFRRLRPRPRQIAQALALGERTKAVANRFGLSPGRVSQMRQELSRDWEGFQSGKESKPGTAAAAA